SILVGQDGLYVVCYSKSDGLATIGGGKPSPIDFLLVKFSFNLQQRIWSRYLGGSQDDEYYSLLRMDPSGNPIVLTMTNSTDYPYAGGLPTDNSGRDKLVGTKFSKSGSIIWSGVMAKTDVPVNAGYIYPMAADVDKNGNIFVMVSVENDYVTGPSNNLSTVGTPGTANPVYPGSLPGSKESDMFLLKIAPNGNKLWGTWLGGKGLEDFNGYLYTSDMVLDTAGNPWVVFNTDAPLPTTPDAYQKALPDNFYPAGSNPADFQLMHIQRLSGTNGTIQYSSLYTGSKPLQMYQSNLALDKSTNNLYLYTLLTYFGVQQFDLSEFTTPCAYQSKADSEFGNETELHMVKFTDNGKTRAWGTLFGAMNNYCTTGFELIYKNNKIYVGVEAGDLYSNNLIPQDATTPGVEQPENISTGGVPDVTATLYLATLDEGEIPAGVTVEPTTVSPQTISACVGGLIGTIYGNKVKITAPQNYNNIVVYQWQKAFSATGPWTDIEGATGKNLMPEPFDTAGVFFLRRLTQIPGAYCDKVTFDSSAVVQLTIGPNIAPKANAEGVKYYTCIGNEITLNGSGSGGIAPYTYEWYVGSDTIPGSTETSITNTPEEPTIYTLKVTDSVGCFGLDQVAVEPVSADAGPDRNFCQGTAGVQLGGIPIQGASEVNYSWSPSDGLSCTQCGQPVATPSSETTYTITVSVKEKSGSVCTMTDDVTVNPVDAPNGNLSFAGPDQTVCQGETAMLGLPAAADYSYTWAPGSYLTDNKSAQTTYDAGTEVVPSPLRYSLTAIKDGCIFVDVVKVSTLYFQITPRNLDQCYGPLWFRQEADAGEVNPPGTVFTWEKTSGDGNIEIVTTANNGADAYIRLQPGSGSSVTFRRKTSLNGKDCYSFYNTLKTCTGGGGPACYTEVRVLGGSGCPLPGGGYKVYAKDVNPADYKFKWSPSWAFNNDSLPIPTLITTQAVNISVKATNKWDSSLFCVDTLFVNDPALSVPVVMTTDVQGCKNQVVQIGPAPVQGYSYFWSNTTGFVGIPAIEQINPRPNLKFDKSRDYVLKVTDIGTGCFAYDTVSALVSTVSADAGPDIFACTGTEVTIGAPPPPGTSFTYLWNPSNVPWRPVGTQGQFDPNPTLLFAGDVTMVVTATDPQTGCFAKDTVVID
ncbi:MAG: hypothetical protein RL013_2814, partial [Bacteroidota bacterium]